MTRAPSCGERVRGGPPDARGTARDRHDLAPQTQIHRSPSRRGRLGIHDRIGNGIGSLPGPDPGGGGCDDACRRSRRAEASASGGVSSRRACAAGARRGLARREIEARRRARRADGAARPALPADRRRGGRRDRASRSIPTGFQTAMMVARDDDVALLRRKAVEFLEALPRRGRRAARDRPRRSGCRASLSLTLGEEIDDEEFAFCLEELGARPVGPRAWSGRSRRRRSGSQGFSVTIIGAGLGGLNAALMLQARRHPVHADREERGRRRHVAREPLSRVRGSTRRAAATPTSSARTSRTRTRSATGPRTSATSTGSPTPSTCATTSCSTPRCAR